MRRRLRGMARVGVSLGLVTALILLFGGGEMAAALARLTAADLLVATLLCSASLALLATRFQRVLGSAGVVVAWRSVYSLQLMGLTMNQFMPGLYGGDLLRICYYMPAHGDKKRFLPAAVVFERLCGLMAMSMVGIVSSVICAASLHRPHWLAMALILLAVLLVPATAGRWLAGNSDNLVRLPRWFRAGRGVGGELAGLFHRRRLVGETILLSMASQLVSIVLFWNLLRAMEVALPFAAVAAVVSLGWLLTLLPVSLNGLGLREGGLVAGFVSFGMVKGAALSVSLAALLPTLIHAAAGGALLACNMERIARLRRLVASSREAADGGLLSRPGR